MTVRDSIKALREVTSHPLNGHRRLGATFDYLRWNIGRRLIHVDYVLPLAEQAFIVVSDRENFGTLAYTCSLWDFEEMLFMLHLLRPDDLFLDIGANVGAYTVLAGAIAGARCMAFEPVPATYRRLLLNIRINGIEERAKGQQLAIGDVDQRLSMTADRGGLNHIVSRPRDGATVEVQVRRLDDVLGDELPRLIKIDTEGFELNVLRGGQHTFSNPKLLGIIVELNGSGDRYGNSDAAVHDEIMRYGFAPCSYDPAMRRPARLATFRQSSFNTIYIRDIDAVARIVSDGRKVRVRDREL